MRSILAGTIGLTLGLGGLMAQDPTSPVSLGRPVPAASLGRPTPLLNSRGELPFQPASYRTDKISGVSSDSAPMLAPITTTPDEPPTAPARPMPGEGGPGSSATPPGSVRGLLGAPRPVAPPSYGPVPNTMNGMMNGGAAGGNCSDYPMMGGYGFNVDDTGSRFYASAEALLL